MSACPKCGSDFTVFVAGTSGDFNEPPSGDRYECDFCGHKWTEEYGLREATRGDEKRKEEQERNL